MADPSITEVEMEAGLIQMQRKLSAAVGTEVADEPYFLKDLSFAVEAEFRII